MPKTYVYDVEVFNNFFLAIFKERSRPKWEIFEVSPWVDNRVEFKRFLDTSPNLIGFNNLSYDNKILSKFLELFEKKLTVEDFCIRLKRHSDKCIKSKSIDPSFKSLDLYRVWHFNNKARAMSLKAVQAAIKFENILESSIDFSDDVTLDSRFEIIEYCKNDVKSTEEFLKISKDKIQLRKELSEKFSTDFTNTPDASIGEKIFSHYLSETLDIDEEFLSKMRSERSKIFVRDIIIPEIEFNTEHFKAVLEHFNNLVVDLSDKKKFKLKITHNNTVYDFGLGGIHALNKKKSWKTTDSHVILDLDVVSYYPNLCIEQGWFPEHLTEKFVAVYKRIVEERKQHAKGTAMNAGLKLASNGSYGKFKDINSFLYDPEVTYKITINGQLLLLMLNEWMIEEGIEIISSNTDGTSLYVPVEKEKIVLELISKWENLTGLKFEVVKYDAMYYRDVNNYIWIKSGEQPKLKGVFEVVKEIHKDQSCKVVAKSLVDYYSKNIPVEETLSRCELEDFFVFQRVKSNCVLNTEDDTGLEKQQKVTRFVVTNNGKRLLRKYEDRDVGVAVGKKVTILNDLSKINITKSDIDMSFYREKIIKIINAVK